MRYLFLILLLPSVSICAQSINYNTIILPKNTKGIDIKERLVQLAWENGPTTQILDHRRNTANYELKKTRFNFLDYVRLTGNLNEFNLDKASDSYNQSQFFPRYNISASVTIGNFFLDPIRTKISREQVGIANQNINLQKLAVRAEVLSKYQIYLSNKEIFEIRSQTAEDSFSDYKLKEKTFLSGETTMAEYNSVSDRYQQHKVDKATAAKDLLISKIELEQLIGMRLEDVQLN